MKRLIIISFFLIGTILQYSCADKKSKPPILIENDENMAKVIALANDIDASIKEGATSRYLDLWDNKTFKQKIRRSMNSYDFNRYVESFISGVSEGLQSFPDRIISQYQVGAYYDFVRIRYDEDIKTYYILFRFYSESEGINYHDYSISVDDNGAVKFSDIYVYLTGEHFSETIGRLGLLSFPRKSLFKSESTTLDAKMKEVEHLKNTAAYLQNNEYQNAYDEINKIKSDLGKSKSLLLKKSQIAFNLDIDVYKASIEDIMREYPDDVTLNILYIDYYALLERYEKAIRIIDELELKTGDDFVRLYKAHIYYSNENTRIAIEHYDHIIENYGIFEAYANKIAILTERENYSEATDVLRQLIKDEYDKELIIEYLNEVDESGENFFSPLLESEPYSQWLEEQ